MTWGDGTPYDTSLAVVNNRWHGTSVFVIAQDRFDDTDPGLHHLVKPMCQGVGNGSNSNW